MTVLTKELKHRLIGMLVLFALVIIFVPVIFDRPDEQRPVAIKPPPAPNPAPIQAQEAAKTAVPLLAPVNIEAETEAANAAKEEAPALASNQAQNELPKAENTPPISRPQQAVSAAQNSVPVTAKNADKKQRLDANGLPITWSVQLASFSKREAALKLQTTLRGQGYNAYIREVSNMHRLLVGPVIDYSDAEKIKEKIAKDHKLKDVYIIRFTP